MLYRCDPAVDVGPAGRLGGQSGEHAGAAGLAGYGLLIYDVVCYMYGYCSQIIMCLPTAVTPYHV